LTEREQPAAGGHQREDGREQARQLVALQRRDRVLEEARLPHSAIGHLPDEVQREQRQCHDRRGTHGAAQPWQHQRAADQHQGRMDHGVSHRCRHHRSRCRGA
jgi:hypothetical protein